MHFFCIFFRSSKGAQMPQFRGYDGTCAAVNQLTPFSPRITTFIFLLIILDSPSCIVISLNLHLFVSLLIYYMYIHTTYPLFNSLTREYFNSTTRRRLLTLILKV